MKAEKKVRGNKPAITDSDAAMVLDNPEWKAADFAAAKPFANVFPDLAAAIRKTRGKQKSPTKVMVSLRLDRDVVEKFRATGDGWQSRIADVLKKAAG